MTSRIEFDGTDDYATISGLSSTLFVNSFALEIEVVFDAAESVGGLFGRNAYTALAFSLAANGVSVGTTAWNVSFSGAPSGKQLQSGVWRYVFDTNETGFARCRMFHNGIEMAQAATSGTYSDPPSDSGDLYIGQRGNGTSFLDADWVASVKCWDAAVVPSDADQTSDLVFHLDNASGSTWTDAANSNDATLSGSPTISSDSTDSGNEIDFDGSSTEAYVPYAVADLFSNAFALEYYATPDSISSGIVISKNAGANLFCGFTGSRAFCGTTAGWMQSDVLASAAAAEGLYRWVYDPAQSGAAKWKLFIDEVEQTLSINTAVPQPASAAVYLVVGQRGNGTTWYDGKLRALKVWNNHIEPGDADQTSDLYLDLDDVDNDPFWGRITAAQLWGGYALSDFTESYSETAPAGSATSTGYAPIISTGSGAFSATVPAGAGTATGYAPAIIADDPGLNPDWTTYRVTENLLAEWVFDEGSGNTVADSSGNGHTIDLTLPASQSFSWQTHGIRTTTGIVETPAVTGVKTIVALIRQPAPDGAYFVVSGGSTGSGGGMVTAATASGTQLTYAGGTQYVGRTRGVFPIRLRNSNRTQARALHNVGWQIVFFEDASAFNTAMGFGGRQGTTLARMPQLDIAYAALYSGSLNDAKRESLYNLARSILDGRSERIDYRECATQANTVYLLGDSQVESRAPISGLSAGDQLRTTPANTFILNEGQTPGAAQPLEMGVNQQDDDPANDFGGEMSLAWSHEDGPETSHLYILKGGIGGSKVTANQSTPFIDASRWAVQPWDDGAGNGIGDSHLHDFFERIWRVEAEMIAADVGPALVGMAVSIGGNDAVDEDESLAFESDLTLVFTRVREQAAQPTMKIALTQIVDNDPVQVYDDNVRAAIVNVAAADSNITLIDNSTWTQLPDAHYDAGGAKAMGEAWYANLFGLVLLPPPGSGSGMGYAPAAQLGGLLSPGAGGGMGIGHAPILTIGGAFTVTVPAGLGTGAGYAPSVTVGATVSIEVPAGSGAGSGFVPLVSIYEIPFDTSHYLSASSKFILIQGDDYRSANRRNVDIDIDFSGDPTDWTVTVEAWSQHRGSFQGIASLIESGDEYLLRVEWDGARTQSACTGDYTWQAKLKDPDGLTRTMKDGPLVVSPFA